MQDWQIERKIARHTEAIKKLIVRKIAIDHQMRKREANIDLLRGKHSRFK